MDENRNMFVPTTIEPLQKDAKHRLISYADWLTETHKFWYEPDLNAYRDYLVEVRNLKASSVAANVGAIRTRYRALLAEENIREVLKTVTPEGKDEKAFVASAIAKMQEATMREAGHIQYQRNPSVMHLTTTQINELIQLPNLETRQGIRDLCSIGLMLCAGISETELCELTVSMLDPLWTETAHIIVPSTPGGMARVASIYDGLVFNYTWLTQLLQLLLKVTNITTGKVILGFFRGGQAITGEPITPRAIQKMLRGYKIHDANGETLSVTALNLQRTYARRLFKAGVALETIQANLGHGSPSTTLEYVGQPDLPGIDPDDAPADAGLILR